MSEQPTPETPGTPKPDEKPQEGTEAKTFDEAYVKKLRDEAAKYRTEAKANADAAKRLSDLEQAQLSESDKVAKRLSDAGAEVATVPSKVADALRDHLVGIHEINEEDAELFLTATTPELLLKQIERLTARNEEAGKPRSPRPDRSQGRPAPTGPTDPRAADLAQIEADLAANKRG